MANVRANEWIVIGRSIEAVFDAIADPETWARSEPGVEFDVSGPLRVGTRIRATARAGGRPEVHEAVVAVFERPRRFGVQARGEAFHGSGLVELGGDEHRTRVSVEVELAPRGLVSGLSFGLGGRFIGGAISKVVRQKLDELKAELESVEPRERA